MFKKKVVFFTACFFLLSGYAGCKKKGEESSPSTPPADPSVAPSLPPVGVVDEAAGFYVKVRPPKDVTYVMHRSTVPAAQLNSNYSDWTTECTIPNNATSLTDKDIFCLVEGEELDLYKFGVEFQINLPKEKCPYMVERPYYYFGSEYGQGFTSVNYQVNSNGQVINVLSTAIPSPVPSIQTSGIRFDGSNWCMYDYSPNGPNCCYGTYSKTVTVIAPSIPPVPQTTIGEWGGKPGNCIVGPGGENPRAKGSGMPLSYIYSVSDKGINKTLKVKAPIEDLRGSNLYATNYIDAFKTPSPAAPKPFYLYGPYRGNLNYTWTCYDESEEVLMRIRVAIRDWNRKPDFVGAIAGTTTVRHDATGTEPDWPGEPYNDLDDWPELVNWFGDNFPGTNY